MCLGTLGHHCPMQHWDTITQCQKPQDQKSMSMGVDSATLSSLSFIRFLSACSIYHCCPLMVTSWQFRVATLAASPDGDWLAGSSHDPCCQPWWWLAGRFELRPLLPALVVTGRQVRVTTLAASLGGDRPAGSSHDPCCQLLHILHAILHAIAVHAHQLYIDALLCCLMEWQCVCGSSIGYS